MSSRYYKITIEDESTGNEFHFFVSNLDPMLEGVFFNTEFTDKKNGVKDTIKGQILYVLNKKDSDGNSSGR